MDWFYNAFSAVVGYFSGPLGQLELVATVLILANVYMLSKENIWNYIPGTMGVILYGWIFYQSNLLADMLLQWAFYVPMQVIGFAVWYWCGEQDKRDSLEVTVMSPLLQVVTVLAILPATYYFGQLMLHYRSDYAVADAAIAVISIVATVLMTRKLLESWVLWIVVDLIAINVYYLKGLYVTSGLYVVLLGLAVYGLLEWIKSYRTSNA